MLSNVLTTGSQVLILILLLGVGFLCGKLKVFSDESIAHLSAFQFKVVAPCAIIQSFFREYESKMLTAMGIVALIALAYYAVSAVLAVLTIRRGAEKTKRVLRFGAIFGNCGYMGLPLQQVLFGADGVFYGAVFIAVYNIVQWTYGLFVISGDRRQLSLKKLLNPGLIGVLLGMILFVCSIELPEIISSPISYLAALNVPVPMVISGYYLSKANFRTLWFHANYYVTIALRLVVLPAIFILLMRLLKLDATLAASCLVDIAVPVAASTTMFSVLYRQDSETAANIVSISTLLSILTLPLMIALGQSLFWL